MKTNPAFDSKAGEDEIAALMLTLRATRQRLEELTGRQVDGALHSIGDRNMLREAQEKLHESNERFSSFFAASATGIAVSTPHGSYLQANGAYCRMVGYTEDELRALTFASLTHPDDLGLNLKLRDELLSGERESFLFEKRYQKKNGDIVWARHSVSAARASSGEITALMVIADRKLAEEALAQSEERLHLITNLVPHGIFAKDAAPEAGVKHLLTKPYTAETLLENIGAVLGETGGDAW
jgi:PAS domain S-box-containing protein